MRARAVAAVVGLAVLAAGAEARAGAPLAAAAGASPRPAECSPSAPRGGAERVWDRARSPGLASYCSALARGYARLRRTPEAALQAAAAASRILPNQVAPQVLEARALVALGRYPEAWQRFSGVRSRARRELEVPAALHDFAVAASATGHGAEALAAYRALVPRAGLLDEARRLRVLVEASVTTMATGPQALDEAIGYLNEARRRSVHPGLEPLVLGALALALDRQGHTQQARGLLSETTLPDQLLPSEGEADKPLPAAKGFLRSNVPLVPAAERDALAAILLERLNPEEAGERWKAFLSGPGGRGAWAEHARKKQAAVEAARARSR
jgi:tetratricopeptide (TPR) repeat protein